MPTTDLAARAAAPLRAVSAAVRPDQLDAPTPCSGYDVRGLLNHLLFWGPSLAAAGRKEAVPPPGETEDAVDLMTGDWTGALSAQLDRAVDAWSHPDAWHGLTSMGTWELPAQLVGGMLLGELVVHGWDLARAIDQRPAWDDDLVTYLHQEVSRTTEQGREMGAYGPEVAVAPTAPLLDRILGLTGRNPGWTAATSLPEGGRS